MEDARPKDLDPPRRQLVALARALAVEPAVLLLSECLDRLEPVVAARTLARLRATGTTLVMATGDSDTAMIAADRVAVMKDGRIVETGSPASLHAAPRTALAAELTGPANLVPASLVSRQEGAVAGPLPAGDRWAVLLRPDMIGLRTDRPESGVPALEGRVAGRSWSPAGKNVLVRIPGMERPLQVRASVPHPGADDLPADRRVWCTWARNAAAGRDIRNRHRLRGLR